MILLLQEGSESPRVASPKKRRGILRGGRAGDRTLDFELCRSSDLAAVLFHFRPLTYFVPAFFLLPVPHANARLHNYRFTALRFISSQRPTKYTWFHRVQLAQEESIRNYRDHVFNVARETNTLFYYNDTRIIVISNCYVLHASLASLLSDYL